MKRLEDLKDHECKFPECDFGETPEFFCAKKTWVNPDTRKEYSYCPEHVILCTETDKK